MKNKQSQSAHAQLDSNALWQELSDLTIETIRGGFSTRHSPIIERPAPSQNMLPSSSSSSSSSSGSCFARDTELLLADGSTITIEKLCSTPGNIQLAQPHHQMGDVLRRSQCDYVEDVIRIQTRSGRAVSVTEYHPMIVVKANVSETIVPAMSVRQGDRIPVYNTETRLMQFDVVTGVTRCQYTGDVYNVGLEGSTLRDHLVIANGIISADLATQEALVSSVAQVA